MLFIKLFLLLVTVTFAQHFDVNYEFDIYAIPPKMCKSYGPTTVDNPIVEYELFHDGGIEIALFNTDCDGLDKCENLPNDGCELDFISYCGMIPTPLSDDSWVNSTKTSFLANCDWSSGTYILIFGINPYLPINKVVGNIDIYPKDISNDAVILIKTTIIIPAIILSTILIL